MYLKVTDPFKTEPDFNNYRGPTDNRPYCHIFVHFDGLQIGLPHGQEVGWESKSITALSHYQYKRQPSLLGDNTTEGPPAILAKRDDKGPTRCPCVVLPIRLVLAL